MAISERNINSDVHLLSQLNKTEETKRNTQNLKRPFKFQIPREILEERVKSWDSFFEKYSMEADDAEELNLETLNPEADPINEYEPERRVPMRNSIASIQYWVDTGKPPCKVYVDENYNSDTGSSLSESELSVPRPAPSLKYSSPHPPQPANVPFEKLQRVSSVSSGSSVNTREYILSATQLTSKKQCLPTMESVIDSKRSAEALLNIEDTYVDVCGTDELPKILDEEAHIRAAGSMSNCQINELERPFILSEMFDKNLPDKSAIIRVTTTSLKIGDIIPSLQQIRDGPENFNCNDVYSDHLLSNESEDLIECRNINSSTIPSQKIDEPVIKVKELGRRKLFTNSQSPIELIPTLSQSSCRFSSNTNLHPALAQYEVLQNQSKKKSKKSLFQLKKKLQDIVEEDKGNVNTDKVRGIENNEKNKRITAKQDKKIDSNVKDTEKINKPKDDERLKHVPVVRLKRLSKSFIQSYRHKSAEKKTKRAPLKAKSEKKNRKFDRETQVACISAVVNNEFVTKKELKIRDLIVSLERLPRVVIERLPRKSKSEETSIEKTKGTLTIESSVVPEESLFTTFKSSNINQPLNKSKMKSVRVVESDGNETQNQKLSKKSSSAEKSFTSKTISFSSDEEDMIDIFTVNKEKFVKSNGLLKKGSSKDAKQKDNFFTSSVKINTNLTLKSNEKEQNSPLQFSSKLTNLSSNPNDKNQNLTQLNNIKQTSPIDINNKSENSSSLSENSTQNSSRKLNKKDPTRKAETSPLKLNTETEIPRKSIKKSITFSSDEDDDFTKFITSINKKKFSRTNSNVRGNNETVLNKIDTLNNSSANLKTKISTGCNNNLTESSSRHQKGDKDNTDANYQQTTFHSFRNVDNGHLFTLEIVSSEDSSDSENKGTILRNKKKNMRRNFSETRINNPRRSSRKNLQNSTKIANEKLVLETLDEENSHSSMNSRVLFKTQSEPSLMLEKKDLENKRINESRKTEKIETQKSLIFQTDSGSDSSLEIFNFISRRNKETKEKVFSKIQTPPKNNLQNSTNKNEKINHLSVKLKTTTSKSCDSNLKEESDRDEKDDKENKDANYEETALNSFRNLNNERLLKFKIVSSEDSSDCDNNAIFSRNKKKSLKQNFSKAKFTNPRRSPKNNLQNSTKIASDLETMEGENSQSNENSRILLTTQTNLSIIPEKKNLENKRINESEKVEIIETKKSLISQRDSDSDSSLDMFDFMPRPKEETKDKASSKIQTPSKKLQNNHFHKENVQIAKKIESPLKRSSMFNRKRKKSGCGGSTSSDSEQNQSDLKFTNQLAKSIGTFQNGENIVKILQPKRLRREAEEMSLNSSINIFGDDRRRSSSPNIFGSSNDSSEDENNFFLNFNKRLKTRKSNLNIVKEAYSGVKFQIFRTVLFSESEKD